MSFVILAAVALLIPEKSFDPATFPSLQKCIDTASQWGTAQQGRGVVTLAGSVYEIENTLEIGSHVRLQGMSGPKRTILRFTGPSCASDKDVTGVVHIAANRTDITLKNIDFTRITPGQSGGGWGGIFHSDVVVAVQNPVSQIKVLHCKATDYSALFQSSNMAKWSRDIEIGYCEAVNNRAYFAHLLTTRGLKFHDNVIEQVNLGQKWLHAGAMFRGVQDSEFVNNKLNNKGGGRAFNGLLFEAMPPVSALGGLSGASNVNLVIRGNDIRRTKEEGIIIERSREAEACCVGDVLAATATTLIRKPGEGYGSKGIKHWTKDLWQDRTVVIVNGRGLGQVRQVIANTESALTIDSPWEILPDSSSVFSVMHHTNHVLIEDNSVSDTGKASIAPYMCCGTIVRNNRLSRCMNHEWDTATIEMMVAHVGGEFGDNDGTLWPNYNNLIEGNRIDQQECMIGIRVGNTNFSSQQSQFRTGIATYNIRIENNIVDMQGATNGPNLIVEGKSAFSGSVGVVVESAYLSEIRKVLVRGNSVKNAKYGVWIGAQFEGDENANQGRILGVFAFDNTFASCTTNLYLSKGVTIDKSAPVANIALDSFATSSSVYDRDYYPQYACDGNIGSSGWSSSGAPGETPWLQLDLGQKRVLTRIEVVLRQDYDQPATRKNFQVLASNTPDFKSSVLLGRQGETSLPHQATFSVALTDKTPYRYLRIAKTAPEYFFVAEVRAFSRQ
jgi:hypothetical protein